MFRAVHLYRRPVKLYGDEEMTDYNISGVDMTGWRGYLDGSLAPTV